MFEPINKAYFELIEPENLLEHIEDFDEWLNLSESKQDLEHTLKEFEKSELYEYCAKIRDKIKSWKEPV